MKICKVRFIKCLNGTKCDYIYPNGYKAHQINIISYDETLLSEDDNISYCIGIVADDFVFTNYMAEITRSEAEKFIDDRALLEETKDLQNKYQTRKSYIQNLEEGV